MIKVRGLVKSHEIEGGRVQAVAGIEFEVPERSFFTLLGPSGCGKTTTMRCVAGLDAPDGGEIEIAGRTVSSVPRRIFVPPHQRDIGMVFQSYAIWPHMTVFENVAFPLVHRKERLSKAALHERVRETLALVHLDGLEERRSPQLSGGQQQRLALARAIVGHPQVLLLDEPLSNLDAQLRAEMRLELKSLVRRVAITTLYVTHDQLEALTLSDQVAVMQGGKIVQISAPRELYQKPGNQFVAGFIGTSNFFEGTILHVESPGGAAVVDVGFGRLRCLAPNGKQAGEAIVLAVRPEHFEISTIQNHLDESTLKGKVAHLLFLGEALDCHIEVSGRLIRVRMSASLDVKEGDEVFVRVGAEHCVPVEAV
jgi:iron(III) transport system ATP-binding protein